MSYLFTNTAESSNNFEKNKEEVRASQKYHKPKSTECDDSAGIGKGGNRFLKKKNLEPGSSLEREEPTTTSEEIRSHIFANHV